MEVTKSAKGSDLLLYQGYAYTRKKTSNGWIRWQCQKQRTEACHGALTTDENPIANPKSFKAHNHEADLSKMEAIKCRDELKETAKRNPAQRTAPLVANALQTLSPQAMACAGSIETIKRDVQRQKAKTRPNEPATLSEINVQPPWTTTGGAHPVMFLLHDSGANDPQRMLIFAVGECLQLLATSPEWFMDGNFKLAPSMFLQLCVIRVKLDDGAVSCVYSFLAGKAKENYYAMFAALNQRCNAIGIFLAPTTIHADFETAVFNTLRRIYGPLIDIRGCFYHLCQSTWRHIQQLGLTNLYRTRDDVKIFVDMMDVLAFLPLAHINAGVAILQNVCPDPSLIPLLVYFLDTYVQGVFVRNAQDELVLQRGPLFPPQVWNMYVTTLNGGSRTNNICEGWNNSFRALVGQVHPPLFLCIEALQRDVVQVRTSIFQSRNGILLHTPVKRSCIRYQQNLQRLCQLYQQGQFANNIQGFMERVSYNIRF